MPCHHNVEEQGYLLLPPSFPFRSPPPSERERGGKALALAVEKRTISRCELSTARFWTPLIYEGNDSLIDLVPERERIAGYRCRVYGHPNLRSIDRSMGRDFCARRRFGEN